MFPDPVTPLTSDTALWLAELGWRDAWLRIGAFEEEEFPADTFCQLGVQGGYCYLNASLIRLFAERAPGMSYAVTMTIRSPRRFISASSGRASFPAGTLMSVTFPRREGRCR